MTHKDDECLGSYASPPCYMHELDPSFAGLADFADPQQRTDVMRWRKAERERLLKQRLEISQDERQRWDGQIAARLEQVIGGEAGKTIGIYAPIRGEPALLTLPERLSARGFALALPVITAADQPLQFRRWAPGEPLVPGVGNIPVPAADAETVLPDMLIVPLLGFDRQNYRLGYGEGYFDHTLALPGKPLAIGVGYSQAALPTIFPQPHDVPMDIIVTENNVIRGS